MVEGTDTSPKKKRGPGRPKRVEGVPGLEQSAMIKSDGDYWPLENVACANTVIKDGACDSDTEDEEEETKGVEEGEMDPLSLNMIVMCEPSKPVPESSSSSSSYISIPATSHSSLLGKRRA